MGAGGLSREPGAGDGLRASGVFDRRGTASQACSDADTVSCPKGSIKVVLDNLAGKYFASVSVSSAFCRGYVSGPAEVSGINSIVLRRGIRGRHAKPVFRGEDFPTCNLEMLFSDHYNVVEIANETGCTEFLRGTQDALETNAGCSFKGIYSRVHD